MCHVFSADRSLTELSSSHCVPPSVIKLSGPKTHLSTHAFEMLVDLLFLIGPHFVTP